MARFYGKVGFAIASEIRPGVWDDTITERYYFGDTIRNTRRHESGQDKVLDDVNISNEFSIIADAFANENFHHIKYVEYMGVLWKVSTIAVQRPRLILSTGGVYNGPQASTA